MERELWSTLSKAIHDLGRARKCNARFTYHTEHIVRVYLWSVLHDRPVCWACNPRNWLPHCRPRQLPHQSQMSRRLRLPQVQEFLSALGKRIAADNQYKDLVQYMDGKPFPVSRHSQDADATWGRGAGGQDRGYKLHAIWGSGAMPTAWQVQPLGISEKTVAPELIAMMPHEGYLAGDGNYDSSAVFDVAGENGVQLVAPRAHPGTGLGHHYQSPYRLRSIELLEGPSQFGTALLKARKQIEGKFSGLVCFGAGLHGLPPWVRTLPRVRLYIHAKLIINAARIRHNAA